MTYTVLDAHEAVSDDAPSFAFSWVTGTPELVGADTLSGICDWVIDGYDELEPSAEDPDPWLGARFAALAQAATAAQVVILDQVFEQDPELQNTLGDEAITALLHPKDEEVLVFDEWPHDVPLILMATGYEPYGTGIAAPSGRSIVWVTPHDERLFLKSLEALGHGALYLNAEELERVSLAADEVSGG